MVAPLEKVLNQVEYLTEKASVPSASQSSLYSKLWKAKLLAVPVSWLALIERIFRFLPGQFIVRPIVAIVIQCQGGPSKPGQETAIEKFHNEYLSEGIIKSALKTFSAAFGVIMTLIGLYDQRLNFAYHVDMDLIKIDEKNLAGKPLERAPAPKKVQDPESDDDESPRSKPSVRVPPEAEVKGSGAELDEKSAAAVAGVPPPPTTVIVGEIDGKYAASASVVPADKPPTPTAVEDAEARSEASPPRKRRPKKRVGRGHKPKHDVDTALKIRQNRLAPHH